METPMTMNELATNPQLGEILASLMGRAALKRPLQTSDTASLVFFLSSPESSMITGEDIAIDGGTGIQ
jgi:NAD(P)-dependent dehydrogenase (short-subunit alcohol dehydrogenase family)